MSTCISSAGEYSEHEPGDWCPRCGAFNEAAIVAERDRLRAWKEEALPVMSGLQELGRALGIRIGESITARKAVDAALDLRNERDQAVARLAPEGYEYGFDAPGPVPGLMYVTRNELLAETMQVARPDVPMMRRPSVPWQPVAEPGGSPS
jgi:hypothetical protein